MPIILWRNHYDLALIWMCLYDLSLMWMCLYDLSLMWVCLYDLALMWMRLKYVHPYTTYMQMLLIKYHTRILDAQN